MLTFVEFLHGDTWRKPIKPPEDNAVIAMIVKSGLRGVTRSELGSAIDMPSKILDELLDMLVRNAWVTVRWDGENHVYRTLAFAWQLQANGRCR
jgi:hypothetical protein